MRTSNQNARQRKNVFMWQQVLNCSESKPVDYRVVESYMGFVVSDLPVKADELEDAIIFAINNRRHKHDLIEISAGGEIVAMQDRIDGQWVKS